MLQPQDSVGEDAAHQAENQHREGILLPILLPRAIHAHERQRHPLQRPENRIEKCFPFRIKHLGKIDPQGFGQQGKQPYKDQ